MKLYLDDERTTPEGWVRTFNPEDTIFLIKNGSVSEISLDHDLGLIKGTGYDVLLWIEKEVATKGYMPPKINIHTSNPSARIKMMAAVRKIEELAAKNMSR